MSEREEVLKRFRCLSSEEALYSSGYYNHEAMADRIAGLERALAARDAGERCSACHGEGEVSEHECCGQSTSGECCGNSVEVRVKCLFCGDSARDAKPTEEMLQRAIAGFMGSFDKSFEDSMYNALKAALNPNQT